MSSFGENKAVGFLSNQDQAKAFLRYNTRQMSRIYPAGTRTDSSNFKPFPFWNAGCQIGKISKDYPTIIVKSPTLISPVPFSGLKLPDSWQAQFLQPFLVCLQWKLWLCLEASIPLWSQQFIFPTVPKQSRLHGVSTHDIECHCLEWPKLAQVSWDTFCLTFFL